MSAAATTSAPAVTLGAGVRRPQGRRVALDPDDPVADLARVLDEHRGDEAWWAPSTFDGDYRANDRWIASWVLGADLDFHDVEGRHSCMPPEFRARAAALLPSLPATLAHITPRGLRVVGLLDAPIVDLDAHGRASHGFASDVREVLSDLMAERDGLRVDGASYDRARLLYTPRSTVGGIQRACEIVRVGGVLSAASLSARAPCVPSAVVVPAAERTQGGSAIATQSGDSRDTSDSGQDASEALRLVRRGATDPELEVVLRSRPSYCKRAAQSERRAEDYLRRTIAWARAQPVLVIDPWVGAIRTIVVVAKYRYEAAKPWAGKAEELHRVRLQLATEDGELLEPRRYITLPIGDHHESARKLFDSTIGDLGPPDTWLTSSRPRLEAAIVGRRMEVVMPAGPMRRVP